MTAPNVRVSPARRHPPAPRPQGWLRRHLPVLGLAVAVLVIAVIGAVGRLSNPHPPAVGYRSTAVDPHAPPLVLGAASLRTLDAAAAADLVMTTSTRQGVIASADGHVDFAAGTADLVLHGSNHQQRQRIARSAVTVERDGRWQPVPSTDTTLAAGPSLHPVDPALLLHLLAGVTDTASLESTVQSSTGPRYRYRATIDLDKTAARNALDPTALQQLRTQLPRPRVEVEVEVDDAGRLCRVVVPLAEPSGATLTAEIT